MPFHTSLSGENSAHYLALIGEAALIRQHAEFLRWLQGDVQHYLPHDILLAGWGNFQEKVIHHDMLSWLPGVRSYAVGTDGLPFLLSRFYDCWVGAGRKPCSLSFEQFAGLLGQSSLPNSFGSALRGMRSVLIHGLRDERSQQECIYILLNAQEIPAQSASRAIGVLMPCIDAALRQLPHLPQQKQISLKSQQHAQDEALGLSERESQIMDWVAMGKTNSEIGCILNISAFTVKNHMQRIFQKLNVFNRAQAVSKLSKLTLNG
jgi:transcriptional regulator EpsA